MKGFTGLYIEREIDVGFARHECVEPTRMIDVGRHECVEPVEEDDQCRSARMRQAEDDWC
jgi:hypothetical protein